MDEFAIRKRCEVHTSWFCDCAEPVNPKTAPDVLPVPPYQPRWLELGWWLSSLVLLPGVFIFTASEIASHAEQEKRRAAIHIYQQRLAEERERSMKRLEAQLVNAAGAEKH